MKVYSTREVCAILGVTQLTLQRWLQDGLLERPEIVGRSFLWLEKDVNRAKKLLSRRRKRYGKLKQLAQRFNDDPYFPILSLVLSGKEEIAKREVFTPEELAEVLKVKVSWIYDQTRKRAASKERPLLRYFKEGRYLRFRREDVVLWLDALARGGRL
jgi:excisionase family DNA binding protein